MTPFLDQTVAVVTGASDGLGAAAARLLSRAGASVVITARRQDRLDLLARIIEADGGRVLPRAADLASDAAVGELVADALDRFGQIDFVLNIGGSAGAIGTSLWQVSPADWAQVEAANLTGTLNLIRHLVPHMLERQQGRMLFLSSSATVRPVARTGAYTATKAAVNSMVQTLALEMDGAPIAFNAFNPGPIDTPTYRSVVAALNQPQQMLQIARPPEEAAVLPLWLCSPETYGVTGEFVQWRDPDVYPALNEFAAKLQLQVRG